RTVKVLPQASLQCLRTSRPIIKGKIIKAKTIHDALLPSTATAHICRVPFSKTLSKRWLHMTWSLDPHTTEATISSGQRLLILRFSQATEWEPAARWSDSYRTLELLSFP